MKIEGRGGWTAPANGGQAGGYLGGWLLWFSQLSQDVNSYVHRIKTMPVGIGSWQLEYTRGGWVHWVVDSCYQSAPVIGVLACLTLAELITSGRLHALLGVQHGERPAAPKCPTKKVA